MESELKGSFTDLRKALFVVDEEDSSLLASVLYRTFYFKRLQFLTPTLLLVSPLVL